MIAVVIVDYLCEALTRRAVASMRAAGRDDLRFYVVDNGLSIDAAGLEADHPGLTVIRPEANGGFAAGCNIGLQRALADGAGWCLLLNPDTVAERDFLSPMLAVMAADPSIGMACPTILEYADRRIAYGGGAVNWWTGRPHGITGRRLGGGAAHVEVPFATGAAMLLRASAADAVGPMDEGYFLYFEDADYCQAFLRAGWKIAYVPAAEILHETSSTTGVHSENYVYYFARNRIRFMRRRAAWPRLAGFLLFNTVVRLPGALVVFGLLRRRPRAALAFLRGWVAGMAGR